MNCHNKQKDVSYFSIYTCSDCILSILAFVQYYFLNLTITIDHYRLPLLCLVGMDMSYLGAEVRRRCFQNKKAHSYLEKLIYFVFPSKVLTENVLLRLC